MTKLKGTIIVDTKETVWYRQYFDLDEEMTPQEFIEAVEQKNIESYMGEYVDDSTEQLSVEDNGGFSTIEIYKNIVNPSNLLFQNGK